MSSEVPDDLAGSSLAAAPEGCSSQPSTQTLDAKILGSAGLLPASLTVRPSSECALVTQGAALLLGTGPLSRALCHPTALKSKCKAGLAEKEDSEIPQRRQIAIGNGTASVGPCVLFGKACEYLKFSQSVVIWYR